ncbi:MAG: 50S ribosomal protein L4 [bacterium]
MATVNVVDANGNKTGTVDLNATLFEAPVNKIAVRLALNQYRANQRQGTSSAKTRRFVSGGGKKPWKQKHTGRARAGSNRSPLWRHGAVIFPPQPRSYRQKLNRKVKRSAFASALSSLREEGRLLVVEQWPVKEFKTKTVVELLGKLKVEGNCLMLTHQSDEHLQYSARNLNEVKVSVVENLNIYDLLTCDTLVASKAAVEKLQEMMG